MKNPKKIIEDTFEPIRRKRKHGPHLAKAKRGQIPRCNGKNSYRTGEQALNVRKSLLDSRAASYLRVYRCPNCCHWHLTHLRPR